MLPYHRIADNHGCGAREDGVKNRMKNPICVKRDDMDKKKKLIFRLVLVLLFTWIVLATSNNLSAFRTSSEDQSHI